MAANNNLTDFLTSIADAIRKKKGTNEPINPQKFVDEIESIQGGGGSGFGNLNIRSYGVESNKYKNASI